MDETIYIILKLLFDFALEVRFSICTFRFMKELCTHVKKRIHLYEWCSRMCTLIQYRKSDIFGALSNGLICT